MFFCSVPDRGGVKSVNGMLLCAIISFKYNQK